MSKTTVKTALSLLHIFVILTACAPAPTPQPTLIGPTASALPAAGLPTLTGVPTITPIATQAISGDLFAKVSHSTTVLHLKCDPLEIIFNVTVKDPQVKGVAFFFRMKDKTTGLVNDWSNGDDMRAAGQAMFQFVFQARAIPDEARYKDAWLQYQFAGLNQVGESLGRSQIFAEEITYTTACP